MTLPYRIDSFLLDPATRELRENGELVALPARAFDCLAYLIQHRDRAVGRDELIAAVWGRAEVSDALLSHTIVRIRRSLGDTGNDQRTIRTVPRFGYRWVGAIADEPAAVEVPAPALDAGAPSMPDEPLDTPATPDATRARPRRSRWWLAGLATALAAVVLATAIALRGPVRNTVVATAGPEAGRLPETIAMPALVLPAEVSAPDDWRWLRFGLMDLVANRLRDGAVPTMSSESVVGLLKQRGPDAGDPLHDPAFSKMATLRVLPRVRYEKDRWSVRLDAFGTQRSLSVEAEAGDAIKAAREATDALLRKLGHAADLSAGAIGSPALDDLLQRSGAAMLADQLDEARRLIAAAAPELQQQPRVEQRMAQIELRAGDYGAAEARLHALLDRLSPVRDAALRARALMTLAAAYVRQGHEARAGELYEEAIALRKDAADHEVLGVAYLGRGVVFAQQERFDEATVELSRARIELETIGDGLGVAGVDVNLGDFQLSRHRPADALPILRNAAREFEQLGAREGLAHALAQQAAAEREMLEFDAALGTTQRFWPAEAHTNNIRMRWTLVATRAAALADKSRFDEAQRLVERIRGESDLHKDEVARAQARVTAAGIAWLHGDADAAARFAADARLPSLRDADPSQYARVSLLHASALRQAGHGSEAAAIVQELRAAAGSDEWRTMVANLAEAGQAWSAREREPALEKFALAMQAAERFNVPEDLVGVAVPYLEALIDASQLDTARAIGGRIAAWADRDPRAATAQAHLYRSLGLEDAARKAEETIARIVAGQKPGETPARP